MSWRSEIKRQHVKAPLAAAISPKKKRTYWEQEDYKRCHSKGSTFSSVIFRPRVLARPRFETGTSRGALPTGLTISFPAFQNLPTRITTRSGETQNKKATVNNNHKMLQKLNILPWKAPWPAVRRLVIRRPCVKFPNYFTAASFSYLKSRFVHCQPISLSMFSLYYISVIHVVSI